MFQKLGAIKKIRMRICIAQTKSEKGEIELNVENHLKLINRAIALNSDLIIFPELSITSYEPDIAKEFAVDINDAIFNVFQKLSDKNEIVIGVGMPTKAIDGINISMLIFEPNKERIIYNKSLLHSDELPYFVSGSNQPLLELKGKKIALGICYETLQREHFIKAKKNGADVYIASVAKPDRGTDKAYVHFPAIAKEFETPILMSNSIGYCDNFLSNGLSSVWNKKGELIGQLDKINQGLLIYDTKTDITEVEQLRIQKGSLSDLDALFRIYRNGKTALEKNGIYQWTDNYPTRLIVQND